MREPNLGAKLFLGGVGVQKTGTEIETSLNNIDVSSEYVLKLKHEIKERCTEVTANTNLVNILLVTISLLSIYCL